MNEAKLKKKAGRRLNTIIKSILRKDQMSYQDFIDRIGIPAKRLESYKEGKRSMPLKDIEKFIPFGVDMDFLCSGEDSVFRSNLDQVLALLPVFPSRGENHLPPLNNRQATGFEVSFFYANKIAALAYWLSRWQQRKKGKI
ncbi:MAG: hypothetical protein KAW12_12230 [Candidatus Aminicenantes bacterium]|nr:hypothetical protein [Candidatus Aminicenantes bacterium]